ncbi:MAG: hypothetical protein O7F71_21050 [Gammaproteobacteria bacterium]|nr:hypothetical protein [Gammaproteobacteria bacterium]
MATRARKRTTARKRKTVKQANLEGWVRHGRAAAGSAPRGKDWDSDKPLTKALAAVKEVRVPRPYKHRYPLKATEFDKLKTAAAAMSAPPRRAIRAARIVADEAMVEYADKPVKALLKTPKSNAPAFAVPTAAPTSSRNFEGISATGWLPADCTLAAGPNHVLASVNSSVAIYRKSGGRLRQRTLTAWFSSLTQVKNMTIFDPKALYDQFTGRWILVAVAVNEQPKRSFFLLSVSQTSNPMGKWWNYALDARRDGNTNTNNWADFPAIGVDARAIYITANMFQFNGGFRYVKVRAIPKAGPYSGGTARWWDWTRLRNADGNLAFTVQPCHTYGGAPVEYLVNSQFPSGNRLTLWSLRLPSSAAPTLSKRTVSTGSYSLPPDAAQKGGGTPLNTGDTRLLHAVCRGGQVYTALTKQHNWRSASVAAIHWFQVSGAGASLVQQGVYGANRRHYYFPAMTADTNGNLTMVFSRSSSSEFVSMRQTGRRTSDPLGRLQGSAQVMGGRGNYLGMDSSNRNRWGDYAGIAADPTDGRTIWMYSKYARTGNRWATRIAATRF